MNLMQKLFFLVGFLCVCAVSASAHQGDDHFLIKVQRQSIGCHILISDPQKKTLFEKILAEKGQKIDLLEKLKELQSSSCSFLQTLKQLSLTSDGALTINNAKSSNASQQQLLVKTDADVMIEGICTHLKIDARACKINQNTKIENVLIQSDTLQLAKGITVEMQENSTFNFNHLINEGEFFSKLAILVDLQQDVKLGCVTTPELILKLAKAVNVEQLADKCFLDPKNLHIYVDGEKDTELNKLFSYEGKIVAISFADLGGDESPATKPFPKEFFPKSKSVSNEIKEKRGSGTLSVADYFEALYSFEISDQNFEIDDSTLQMLNNRWSNKKPKQQQESQKTLKNRRPATTKRYGFVIKNAQKNDAGTVAFPISWSTLKGSALELDKTPSTESCDYTKKMAPKFGTPEYGFTNIKNYYDGIVTINLNLKRVSVNGQSYYRGKVARYRSFGREKHSLPLGERGGPDRRTLEKNGNFYKSEKFEKEEVTETCSRGMSFITVSYTKQVRPEWTKFENDKQDWIAEEIADIFSE